VARADMALYQAKNAGRNRVVMVNDLTSSPTMAMRQSDA